MSTITVSTPHVPYPGGTTQADFMRKAAERIEGGKYSVGGSNVTAAVVKLVRDAADALDGVPAEAVDQAAEWQAAYAEAHEQRDEARREAIELRAQLDATQAVLDGLSEGVRQLHRDLQMHAEDVGDIEDRTREETGRANAYATAVRLARVLIEECLPDPLTKAGRLRDLAAAMRTDMARGMLLAIADELDTDDA